jgi:hypothetical protein
MGRRAAQDVKRKLLLSEDHAGAENSTNSEKIICFDARLEEGRINASGSPQGNPYGYDQSATSLSWRLVKQKRGG